MTLRQVTLWADRRTSSGQAREQQPPPRDPAVMVMVRRTAGRGPLTRPPGLPLRAGPVRVEGFRPVPPAGGWDEEDIRLAVLAELASRYLGWGRPW